MILMIYIDCSTKSAGYITLSRVVQIFARINPSIFIPLSETRLLQQQQQQQQNGHSNLRRPATNPEALYDDEHDLQILHWANIM